MINIILCGILYAQNLEPLPVIGHAGTLEQNADCLLAVCRNLILYHVQHFLRQVFFVTVHHEGEHAGNLGVNDELYNFV